MQILIVEDAKETREALKNIILFNFSESVEVYEAENGVEALKLVHDNSIDVVLTDIMMPIMDGFELILAIKNNDDLKHIFVAAITGLSGEEQIKKVFSYGADYYISKPIQKEDITARLKLIFQLVSKSTRNIPEIIRETLNPFDIPALLNYHTIFSILQENDVYQILYYLMALYPDIDKNMLKDLIIFLLKSYELLDNSNNKFEIMIEMAQNDAYLSCTEQVYIDSLKHDKESLPRGCEIRFTHNGMTIKIHADREKDENPNS